MREGSPIRISDLRALWTLKHRRLRIPLILIVLVYLGISLSRENEFFPFFSWKLFHSRPVESIRYTLVLEEVKGKALKPPRNMLEVRGPARVLSSIDSRSLVSKLGVALQKKQAMAVEYRHLLESTFLESLKPIRYQVVAEKFDAESFLAARKISWSESLGAFELR